MRLFLLLMCVSMGAWGAEYWVDLSGTGTGAANGSNVSNLCAGLGDADCTPSAGDTIHACNAATSSTTLNTAGSSDESRITYDATCPGGTFGSLTAASGSALTMGTLANYLTLSGFSISQTSGGSCVFVNASDNIRFEDVAFVRCAVRGINVSATSDVDGLEVIRPIFQDVEQTCVALVDSSAAVDYANWKLQDGDYSGCAQVGTGDYPSIRLTTASGASTTITGIEITGNVFADNSANPAVVIGNQNLAACSEGACETRANTVVDPVITDNTVTGGFGGFSIRHALRGTVSDNVIQGTNNVTGGVVVLYSDSTVVAGNQCRDLTTIDIDGGCVDSDHGNVNVKLLRNQGWNLVGKSGVANSGYMVMVLDAQGTEVTGNICNGCKYGLFLGNNQGLTTNPNTEQHNTFTNSLVADVWMTTSLANNMHTIRNNAFSGSAGYAVNRQGSVDQTMDYNLIHGTASGAYNGQTPGANDVLEDPRFAGGTSPTIAEGHRPRSNSPLCAAGTSVGSVQDYGNRRFKTPPAIGAWECARGSARESVSARTSVNARTTVTAR